MTYSFPTIYLVLINALGLALMLADKLKAIKGAWRIRESTLLGIALLGGSIGVWAGIYGFRHKTRHKKFTIGVPVILCLHILLFVLLKW